jgi:hypothetical protein
MEKQMSARSLNPLFFLSIITFALAAVAADGAQFQTYSCEQGVALRLSVLRGAHSVQVTNASVRGTGNSKWDGSYTPMGDGFGFRKPGNTDFEALMLDAQLFRAATSGQISFGFGAQSFAVNCQQVQ